MIWLAFLVGCPSGTNKDFDGTIWLKDENNYSYSSAIAMTYQEVQSLTDVTFSWDQLTTDIQGHEADSCDEVDQLTLIWFRYLSYDDLIAKTTCDDILQADAEIIALGYEEEPSDCSLLLSEAVIPPSNAFLPGEYFPTTEEGEGPWFVRATRGAIDTVMVALFTASETSTNHDVVLTDESASLTFSADLTSLVTLEVPGQDTYTVDWSQVLAGASSEGCEASEPSRADQLWLARYNGTSVADLEANILDLEIMADMIYVADAGAVTSLDLATAATNLSDGSAFPGFADGDLWLIALRSTISVNPAPIFLGVIQVAG